MKKHFILFLSIALLTNALMGQESNDTLVLRDIPNDKDFPAQMMEINIPSAGAKLQGLIYLAAGKGMHPTVFLLHGFPGNERNLDLAQVLRARGWNVIYFNYRGAWASQGQFSFTNCVEDVVNAVHYAEKEHTKFHIDVNNMVLFGHSMGGWVTLKSIQLLPEIKKAFTLSTWDIAGTYKDVVSEKELTTKPKEDFKDVFVLNTPYRELFLPVIKNRKYYDLSMDSKLLATKKLIILDEHKNNAHIANAIKKEQGSSIQYLVWDTDHPFTNKRISLILKVLNFLEND